MSATLFLAATVTLWWTLHAWRTPQTLHATRFPPPDGRHGHTFSLLLPARHEEAVLAQTVRQLLRSRHRDFELILIVGHDDPATAAVAHQLAAESPQVSVVVDHHAVKNKPKALNTALPRCTGDIVGVFDAEDQVHADLLTHVDYAFRTTDATVVQGGVQLINFHSSWYSVRNCLEYFFWFRSRLHLQAQRGFIPLGGNTVFVRADTLRQVGGWDPQCLAEDCDLGVRLSSMGCKVVVSYDALLVTREETPDSVTALFKQRTRWNQGFLQVLRKGDWRQLPGRRQRLLARYTLASPFVQAFTGVTTLAGFTVAVLCDLPVGIALLSYLPLVPTVGNLFFEVIGLHDFGRQYGVRIRPLDYAKLIAGAPVYMLLLAGAATRAVMREWRGRRDWELTRHVGAHLLPDAPAPATADA